MNRLIKKVNVLVEALPYIRTFAGKTVVIKYGGKGPVLHFNYRTRYNDVWERPDLQKRYGYTATYRKDDQPSASLPLLPAGGGA